MRTVLIFLAIFFAFAVTINAFDFPSLPSPCKSGKEFQFCGPTCPETCQSLVQKQDEPNSFNSPDDGKAKHGHGDGIMCRLCIPGCQCKQGTVEDKASKLCVEPSMCPRNNV
ncbi:SCO-spondin [Aphelenchoides bicaudatus]|nr:SCO-spondin [Aphelenchoides bicaudatus]